MDSQKTTGCTVRLLLAGLIALIAQVFIVPLAAADALPDAVTFGIRVEQGDIRTVTRWLDAGLDPNFEGDRVGTGLMIAAWEGNVAMMELFVKRGADVNHANQFREQALMHAVWKGQREAAAWLLDNGARINREGNEWSALHYAVFAGHEEIARFLIQKKADVNAQSTNGSTVLMMAAHEGQQKIAAMLIEAGAMRSTKNDLGEDALTWAMRYKHLTIAKMVTSD
jgi:ankyrin repeat protein